MATATYQYQSDFARRYFNQGRAEGKAEGEAMALLAVLSARGIEVTEQARERIMEADVDQLDVWVRRAAKAMSIDDILA